MKRLHRHGACLALAATLFASPVSRADDTRRLFEDNFAARLDVGAPGANNWYFFGAGPAFTGNDGIVTTGPRGLAVRARGSSPASGEPMFTLTVPQESDLATSVPGGVDHVKWLVYNGHLAASGFPGHDIAPGKETVCSVRDFGGRTFGTAGHPFGAAVFDANDDLRLAAFAMNSIDVETFLVADWFITNEQIYVFYERLPFGRGPVLGNYAAFSFAIPVGAHRPGQHHDLQTAWSRNYIRWILDGHEVYRVDRLGFRIARATMTLDHGGTEGAVVPRQVDCGMGLFTLLDAYRPSQVGLARLSLAPSFYFDPLLGAPAPERFVDDTSRAGSRLFGQGAAFEVRRYRVLERDARERPHDEHGD